MTSLLKIHLNEVLVERKFAEFSQWQCEVDMMATSGSESESSLLSSVREEGEGKVVQCPEAAADPVAEVEAETSLEQEAASGADLNHNSNQRPSFMEAPGYSSRGQGRGRGRGGGGFGGETSVLKMSSNDNGSSGKKEEDPRAKSTRLLAALKKAKISSNTPESLEAEIEHTAEVEDEEDIWDRIRRTRDTSRDDPRAAATCLPGGVWVGKYHEAVVSRLLQQGARGETQLKEKYVEFVTRGSKQ